MIAAEIKGGKTMYQSLVDLVESRLQSMEKAVRSTRKILMEKKAEAVWLQVIWDRPEKEARVSGILSRELW